MLRCLFVNGHTILNDNQNEGGMRQYSILVIILLNYGLIEQTKLCDANFSHCALLIANIRTTIGDVSRKGNAKMTPFLLN